MKKTLCIVLVLVLAAAAVFFGVQSNQTAAQLTAAQNELAGVKTELEAAAAELATAKADLEAAAAELEAANAKVAELEAAAAAAVADEAAVMTYADYAAAELESEVVVETYVQAKQSWWNDQATLYTQDENGAYFIYNLPCTEEEYNALTVGTKIRVTGYKAEWAGEVEIIDATFEIIEGTYVAEAMDATALLGTEELIASQNMKVAFKGMTIEAVNEAGDAFQYSWDGSGEAGSDSDLYFNASINGQTYTFVVEYYVCDANGVYGAETDVYKAVQALKVGDVVDMEGFLYWYEGAQPHITSVATAA